MQRLIETYYEWDMGASDVTGLQTRLEQAQQEWESRMRQSLASYPQLLEQLWAGSVPECGARPRVEEHQRKEESLSAAATRLCESYDVLMLQMFQQAQKAVRTGMVVQGRERESEFKDAMRLLRGVLDHPVGGRNYVAWFQLGWLLWQTGQPLAESEEAFFQAVRLGASETPEGEPVDRYTLLALLHVAHIQSLQAKHSDAALNIQRALLVAPQETEVLWEAARQALLQADTTRQAQYLRQALRQDVCLVYALFGDADFAATPPLLIHLIQDSTTAMRSEVREGLERCRVAQQRVQEACQKAQIEATLPDDLVPPGSEALETQGLFALHTLHRQVEAQTHRIYQVGREQIGAAGKEVKAVTERLQKQIDRLEKDRQHWIKERERAELAAQEGKFDLHRYGFRNPFTTRKNQIQDAVRLAYETAINHLSEIEEQCKRLPEIEAKLAVTRAHHSEIESILSSLKQK